MPFTSGTCSGANNTDEPHASYTAVSSIRPVGCRACRQLVSRAEPQCPGAAGDTACINTCGRSPAAHRCCRQPTNQLSVQIAASGAPCLECNLAHSTDGRPSQILVHVLHILQSRSKGTQICTGCSWLGRHRPLWRENAGARVPLLQAGQAGQVHHPSSLTCVISSAISYALVWSAMAIRISTWRRDVAGTVGLRQACAET